MLQLLGSTVQHSSSILYPRLIPVHKLNERHGLPTRVEDNVHVPGNIQCSIDKLSLDGVYIYENGLQITLFIGPMCTPELIYDFFGVYKVEEIPMEGLDLSKPLASRVCAIIQQIRKDKGSYRWMSLKYTTEDTKLLLIEDKFIHEYSYVDYLCMVHKKVQTRMENY